MDMQEMKIAVGIARRAIELWTRKGEKLHPEEYPEVFNEKRGVFVTIHTYPERRLRGCIGFPEPCFPLIEALVEAAIASTRDPRFPVLDKDELDKIIIEVSVLTRPELMMAKKPREYLKKIRIGKDGLIVSKGHHSGLLLPQVARKHNLGSEDFLRHTCLKAGLSPDDWLEEGIEVFRFQSDVFSEKSPGRP